MAASKAKERVSGEFVACVVGQSRDPEELFSANRGIGKSCLCYRFVYPGFDGYIDNHPSIFALHEFESYVINNDHFLYWGSIVKHFRIRGSRTLHAPVRVHVIEHTVFYQDETSKPFPKSDRYVKRIMCSLESPGKGTYRSRDELDSHTCLQQYPSKINKLPKGYMVVVDVSQEGNDFQAQLQRTEELLEYLAKHKQKYVIVATKRDISDQYSLRCARDLRHKYRTVLIETSAGGNINVRDAFRLLAHKVFKKSPDISNSIISFEEAHDNSLKARWQVKRAFQLFLKEEVIDSSDELHCIQERKEFQNCKKLTGMFDTGWLFATHILELHNELYSSSNSSDTRQDYLQKFVAQRSDLSTYSQHLKSWVEFVAGEDETDHTDTQENEDGTDSLAGGWSPQSDDSASFVGERKKPNTTKVVDETCPDVNNTINGCRSVFIDNDVTLECSRLTAGSEECAQQCLKTQHSVAGSVSIGTNSESESSAGNGLNTKHIYTDMEDRRYEIIDSDEEDVSQAHSRPHITTRQKNVQKAPPKAPTMHNNHRQPKTEQNPSDAPMYEDPEMEYGIFKMDNQQLQKPTRDHVQHLSLKNFPSGSGQEPTTEHDHALKSTGPVSVKYYEDVEYGSKRHKKPCTAHLQMSRVPAKPTDQVAALKPTLATRYVDSQQQPAATNQSLAFSDRVGQRSANSEFKEIKGTSEPSPYPPQPLTGGRKYGNKSVGRPLKHEQGGHRPISSRSRPSTHEDVQISRSVPSKSDQMDRHKERTDFSRLDSPRTLRRKSSQTAEKSTTNPVKCRPTTGLPSPSSTSNHPFLLTEGGISGRWRSASPESDEDYTNTARTSSGTTVTRQGGVTSSSPEYVDDDYVNTALGSQSPRGTPRTPTSTESVDINRDTNDSCARASDEEDYDYPDFRTQRLLISPHHDSVTDSMKSTDSTKSTDSIKSTTKQIPKPHTGASAKVNEHINKGEICNSTNSSKSNSETMIPRTSASPTDEDYVNGYVNTLCTRQIPSRAVVGSKPSECVAVKTKDDELDYDYPDIYRCFAFLLVSQQKIHQQMAKRPPRRGIENTSFTSTSTQKSSMTSQDATHTRHGCANPPLPSWWLQLTQGRAPPFVQSGRGDVTDNSQAMTVPPRGVLRASCHKKNFCNSESSYFVASSMSDYYVPMASATCTLDDTYINWETIYSNKQLLWPTHSRALPPRSSKDTSVPLKVYSVDDTVVKYHNTLPKRRAHNHKGLQSKLPQPLSAVHSKMLPPRSGKDTSASLEPHSVDDTEVEYLNIPPLQKCAQQLASQLPQASPLKVKCPPLPPKDPPELRKPKQMALQDPPQRIPKQSHQFSQQPVQTCISKPHHLPPQQPLSPQESPKSPLPPLTHQQPPQASPRLPPRHLHSQWSSQQTKQQLPLQPQKETLQRPKQQPQQTSQQEEPPQYVPYSPSERPVKPPVQLPLPKTLEQPPQLVPEQPPKVPQCSLRQSPPVTPQSPSQQPAQSLPRLPTAVKPHENVKRIALRSDVVKQSLSQPKSPQLHPKPRVLTTNQQSEDMSHTKQLDAKLKPIGGFSQPESDVKPVVKPKPRVRPKPTVTLSSKPPTTAGLVSSGECRREVESTSGLHSEKGTHKEEKKLKPVIPARTFTKRLSSPDSTTKETIAPHKSS